ARREFSSRRALCDSSFDYNSEDFRDPQKPGDRRDSTGPEAEFLLLTEKESSFDTRRGANHSISDIRKHNAARTVIPSSFGVLRPLMGQDGDDDSFRPLFFQLSRCFVGSCSRRQHVIDQEDAFAAHRALRTDAKRAAHIFLSFRSTEPALNWRIPNSPQSVFE